LVPYGLKRRIEMIIGIFGASCTGKSSIADEISKRTGAKLFTGKDYLKFAKSEAEARREFIDMLKANEETGDYFI
jgi:uridine kinase